MAKLRPISLQDFGGGLRCDVPSNTIAENELADIENFDVDLPGKLVTRKGCQRISSAGIAAAPVRGVFEHVERDGRKRVIAACNKRLWKLNERNRTWGEIYREAGDSLWGQNLLSNGGFDTDTAGWTLNNNGTNTTVARDTTNPRTGAGCLKIMTTTLAEILTGSDPGLEQWVDTYNAECYDKTLVGTNSSFWRSDSPQAGSHAAGCTVSRGSGERFVAFEHKVAFRVNCNNIETRTVGFWASREASPPCPYATVTAKFYNAGGTPLGSKTIYTGDVATSYTFYNGEIATSDIPAATAKMSVHLKAQVDQAAVEGRSMFFDSLTCKARSRFNDFPLSPAVAIVPASSHQFEFAIRAASASQPNVIIKVMALYYDSGGGLIRTDTILELTPQTTYQLYMVERPAGDAPASATHVRLQFVVQGYRAFAVDSDNGYYIDDVAVRRKGVTPTVLRVAEDVNPTFLSFMGNCYVFGYEKNIKLTNAEAVDFLPLYPESSKYAIAYQNRLFVAGDPTAPSYLYFTNYTEGGEVNPDVIDVFNFHACGPDDGDEITGIAPCGSGIVVFKNRSVYMLTGSNRDDWFMAQRSSAIGCAAHRSIANFQRSVIFLNMSSVNAGVYMYDGGVNFTMLSRKIDPLIENLVNTDRAVGIIHGERYYLFCDSGDATHPHNDQVLVYSLKTGAWTRYTGIHAEAACTRANGAFLAGSAASNGMVLKMLTGHNDDGADIAAQVTTADMALRGMGIESRVRKVSVFANSGTDDQEIEISYAVDRKFDFTAADPMSLEASGTNKWNVGEWNVARWEEAQYLHHTFVPAADHANLFRLKLAHAGNVPAAINGINILERERRVRP